MLDVDHGGKVLSTIAVGRGVDIIAYDPARRHLYLPGAESADLAVIDVASSGLLKLLGRLQTTAGAHCATTDGSGGIYVCDPSRGRLLVIPDPY